MQTKLFLLLVLSLSFTRVFGTTYFITPKGKPANDGKSFATGKDLFSAIPLAKAGDSLVLEGGTYQIRTLQEWPTPLN